MYRMPRSARIAPGGLVYHVLNRTVGRMKMLRHDRDFEAFLRVLAETQQRRPIEIFSYCILANHWHFVVRPAEDGDLAAFFRWLTHTHAMRWRVAHHTVGYGHLYQGRFKSFPVQDDAHLLTVCRYVERHALSAGLAPSAQQWPWSSLWARLHGSAQQKALLAPWPVSRPDHWIERVNAVLTPGEQDRLRISMQRDQPFGADPWTAGMVRHLGIEHIVRREGRPKNQPEAAKP